MSRSSAWTRFLIRLVTVLILSYIMMLSTNTSGVEHTGPIASTRYIPSQDSLFILFLPAQRIPRHLRLTHSARTTPT